MSPFSFSLFFLLLICIISLNPILTNEIDKTTSESVVSVKKTNGLSSNSRRRQLVTNGKESRNRIPAFPGPTPEPNDSMPDDFVYLSDLDDSIIQEIRYAQHHNFVGRPIAMYEKGTCILTRKAAEALVRAQTVAKKYGHTLKVYDCYRPTGAVADFWEWSHDPSDKKMQQEFYPHIHDKKLLFKKEFVLQKSGHSRGSTVDVTLVKLPVKQQPEYREEDPLLPCDQPGRFSDNSVNMGTGYDCFSAASHTLSPLILRDESARKNRYLLHWILDDELFKNFEKEWWHFTLADEPYPDKYFNFPVK